jgi:serine/threonine-protein kinase
MANTPVPDPSTLNSHFEAVVEEILRQREAGHSPDPQRYLDSFPNLATALREFFAAQDLFDGLAPALAPAVRTRLEAATLPMPAAGERVGDFELLEELGRGGMGVVYRARQTNLNRVVALKMIRRGQADDAERARFRVEAEAIARLPHPNIVQIYEVGEHEGMPFLALEHCGGGSLAERLRDATLPPAEAAAVVAALARAMQAAHEQHVIHRDLKPANVLLAGGDAETPLARLTPKVTDFGLARKLDDPGLTQSDVIMGTPSYLAPEQASGRSKEVGPAADVYALGAVLYECLTGRPPFQGPTLLDTVQQVLHSEPVPPSRLQPKVPRDLETICLKCLHKAPDRRYASAAELAEDLGRYLDGRPVQARRVGRAERLLKWVRRRPAAAGLAAALVLLVAGLLVAGWRYQHDQLEQTARKTRDDARQEYVTKEMAAALHTGEHELQELHQALQRLLPDKNHPLSVSVLLSDLKPWQARVQSARALYQQAKKLSGSNPEALARDQKDRLDQFATKVKQAEAQYQIAQQLDSIRLESSAWVDGKFNTAAMGLKAKQVFLKELGLDLGNDPVSVLAAEVKQSPLRHVLVAALDYWAAVAADHDVQQRFLEVARLVDPDPWRDQVRNANTWQELPRLQQLARAAQPQRQTPQILQLLARRLLDKGGRSEASALVQAALLHHPADFWLNFDLGGLLDDPGERVGCYRAALAVRPGTTAVLNDLGNALRVRKDLVGAIACYEMALKIDPKHVPARNNLGSARMEKGDLDGAIKELRHAIQLDRSVANAFCNLGSALAAVGDEAGAIRAFKKAIDVNGQCAAPHYGLGNVYYRKRHLDAAIAAYRQALALDPKYAEAHCNLGSALRDRGDWSGAIAAYRKAIECNPRHAMAHNNVGLALQDKKDLKGAIEKYRQAIALDPGLSEPHNNLGTVLGTQGHLDEAIQEFKKAITLDSKCAGAHYNLGKALSTKGNLDGAILEFRKAIEADPRYLNAHTNLAFALHTKGDLVGAIHAYRKAIELDRKAALLYHNLGTVLLDTKDPNGARKAFAKAIEVDPGFAAAHHGLGVVLSTQGDWAGAVRAYRQAIALDPTLTMPHCKLGRGLMHQGDLAGAIREFKDAIQIDPRDPLPRNCLAAALNARGDLDGAVQEFQKSIEVAPKDLTAYGALGVVLLRQGRFAEARAAALRAAKLVPAGHPLRDYIQKSIRRCEQLLALDQKLAAIQKRQDQPANAAEQLALAVLCQKYKQQYAAAAEFYAAAFAAAPNLEVVQPRRHNAACAAALAAAGKGKDAGQLDAPAKTKLRQQALRWLQADLQHWQQHAKSSGIPGTPGRAALQTVVKKLSHWQADPDLAGVRDAKALAQLPDGERQGWQTLWADVAELLQKAKK